MNKRKVILVTGASAGMGKDFAKALLEQGHVVYAAARRLEQMQDLKDLGALTMKMDITQEGDIDEVITTIETDHGGVDVLINNAGFGMYGAVEDTAIDEARYQFEVNLFGLARITQRVLPYMRAQKSGKIINVSSIGGKIYSALGAWYHGTKHALEGWSDCLRLELQQFGIDVVIIEPGAIKTEFGDVMGPGMMKRSGTGPYAAMATAMNAMLKVEYENGGGSDPKVITDLVVKAISAKRPKTRYAAGKYAGPMLFLRRWLSDRAFDRLVLSTINRIAGKHTVAA